MDWFDSESQFGFHFSIIVKLQRNYDLDKYNIKFKTFQYYKLHIGIII